MPLDDIQDNLKVNIIVIALAYVIIKVRTIA